MLGSFLNRQKQMGWGLQNEYIIAVGLLLFSLTALVAYQGVLVSLSDSQIDTSTTYTSLLIFPIFCVMRLLAVKHFGDHSLFGVVTGVIDVLLLSTIIFRFSVQYESVAATLKAPSFVFYFVLIAFHGMRFRPTLTVLHGMCCVAAWLFIVFLLNSESANFTDSYVEYINSSAVMVGTEIEKTLGLFIFTLIIAYGAKRVRKLHEQKQQAREELYEQERQAQKNLHDMEQSSQEKLLNIKIEEEQKISKLKTEFINTMSHELSTPMNGVLGMLQTLRMTKIDQEQKNMLDLMEVSGQRLVHLLTDILEYSNLEDDQIELNETTFDLKEFVRSLAVTASQENQNDKVKVCAYFDPNTPKLLIGDKARISQVLTYLLDNAIKFTPEGKAGIIVKGAEQGDHATICFGVFDEGIGINKDNLANIFDPFQQVDGSSTREYDGAGLGLALSQRLIRAMGSEIAVKSVEGQGSRFTFDLKLALQKTKPVAQRAKQLDEPKLQQTK